MELAPRTLAGGAVAGRRGRWRGPGPVPHPAARRWPNSPGMWMRCAAASIRLAGDRARSARPRRRPRPALQPGGRARRSQAAGARWRAGAGAGGGDSPGGYSAMGGLGALCATQLRGLVVAGASATMGLPSALAMRGRAASGRSATITAMVAWSAVCCNDGCSEPDRPRAVIAVLASTCRRCRPPFARCPRRHAQPAAAIRGAGADHQRRAGTRGRWPGGRLRRGCRHGNAPPPSRASTGEACAARPSSRLDQRLRGSMPRGQVGPAVTPRHGPTVAPRRTPPMTDAGTCGA